MQIVAKLRYLNITPRKVRLVADLVRKKTVKEAETILNFTLKRTALPLLKLLKSAIANARHNFGLEESNLYVSKIIVDEGPKSKRWRARARGQAEEIRKRASHITLVLDEIEKGRGKIKEVLKPTVHPEKESPEKITQKIPKSKTPKPEIKVKKPKTERGFRRIFSRKAFSK